jgi:hypothetical protein
MAGGVSGGAFWGKSLYDGIKKPARNCTTVSCNYNRQYISIFIVIIYTMIDPLNSPHIYEYERRLDLQLAFKPLGSNIDSLVNLLGLLTLSLARWLLAAGLAAENINNGP